MEISDNQPKSIGELFKEQIAELETAANDDAEGIFRALGFLSTNAILTESRLGRPANSSIGMILDELQYAIPNFDDKNKYIAGRLTGLLDIVFSAAGSLPPQIDDETFSVLSRISEEGNVPYEQVKNVIDPPKEDPQTINGVTLFDVSLPSNLVVHSRIMGVDQVTVSPRGRSAIEAYLNRKLEAV